MKRITVGQLNVDQAVQAIAALDRELDSQQADGEWSQPLCDLRNDLVAAVAATHTRNG